MPFAQKGLSLYISSPNKPTLILINSASYQLSSGFDDVVEEVNTTLKNNNLTALGSNKRNNTDFTYILNSNPTMSDNTKRGINSLIQINNILDKLQSLGQSSFARSVINFTEEHFCYQNIGYQFSNMIYLNIAVIGLVMLSVGTNKLVLMSTDSYRQRMVTYAFILTV